MEDNVSNYNIATAPKDTLKNQVLYARQMVVYELHEYHKMRLAGIYVPKQRLIPAVNTLFRLVRVPLKNEDIENFNQIENKIKEDDFQSAIDAFWIIEDYLYAKRLTSWEDQAKIDGW